jgi:hypothetical protein
MPPAGHVRLVPALLSIRFIPSEHMDVSDFVRRRIYVASSWRNPMQQGVVYTLRAAGHVVYDFRNPKEGDKGFHWSEIDPDWKLWTPERFRESLSHPIAERGFRSDFDAMKWADVGVLVMPCGRSAHLEAGYFVGAGKPLYILLADGEPELMYRMAAKVCIHMGELLDCVGFLPWED